MPVRAGSPVLAGLRGIKLGQIIASGEDIPLEAAGVDDSLYARIALQLGQTVLQLPPQLQVQRVDRLSAQAHYHVTVRPPLFPQEAHGGAASARSGVLQALLLTSPAPPPPLGTAFLCTSAVPTAPLGPQFPCSAPAPLGTERQREAFPAWPREAGPTRP